MKKPKRILCAVLALLMLLGAAAAVSVRPAYAAKTEAELEEEQRKAAQVAALEQKKKEQQEKLKELEKQIADAKAKKNDVMATKNLLDQRNQLLLEQIDDTQNQIDDAAAQIARYELLEEEQYTLFCQQVREEEERGSLSYLSVLFKATSMADLLNRMEFVNEVAEYNKRIISALQETRENIKAEKVEMEAKDPDLKNLVREYHDGLLLFEVSNRTIWGKAASDEAGLLQYFKKHKKQYKWDEPRFKGMAYHVKDEADVAAVRNAVKGLPFGDWADKLRSTFNNDSVIRIRVEKGIFKKGDNPLVDRNEFKVCLLYTSDAADD